MHSFTKALNEYIHFIFRYLLESQSYGGELEHVTHVQSPTVTSPVNTRKHLQTKLFC